MKPSPLKTVIAIALNIYLFLTLIFVFVASHTSYTYFTSKSGQTLLPDFAGYTDVKEKKRAFFDFLEPMVDKANKSTLSDRQDILALQSAFISHSELSSTQRKKLHLFAKRYHLDSAIETTADTGTLIEELLNRANAIPTSLVLAQAANESAWGTSRFAREGNNLFGQWCFTKGCGIIPKHRNAGTHHEVRTFSSPEDSIASYCRNLNTHNAYKGLRDIRSQLVASNADVTGYALAAGLGKYSERGEAYIEELRSMMKSNSLE